MSQVITSPVGNAFRQKSCAEDHYCFLCYSKKLKCVALFFLYRKHICNGFLERLLWWRIYHYACSWKKRLSMCFIFDEIASCWRKWHWMLSVVMAIEHAGSLWSSQPNDILKKLNKMSCSMSELCGLLKPRGPGPAIKRSWKLHFPISSGFGWRLCDVNPRE